jgi:hypothetical protein
MRHKAILVGAFIAGFAMGGCDSLQPSWKRTRPSLVVGRVRPRVRGSTTPYAVDGPHWMGPDRLSLLRP